MKAHNQSGSSIIYLFLFVVVWVFTALLFFFLYGTNIEYEQNIQKNLAKIQENNQEEAELASVLQQLESLTGFYRDVDSKAALKKITDTNVNLKKVITQLSNLTSKENETGNWKHYGFSTWPYYDVDLSEEKLTSIVYLMNLENAIQAFVTRIQELQKELVYLDRAIKSVDIEVAGQEKQQTLITRKQNTVLEDIQKQKENIEGKYQATLTSITNAAEKAKKDKEEAGQEKQKIEKEIQSKKIDFENDLNKRKNQIREIQAAKYGRKVYSEVAKQKEFEASEEKEDGAIVFADPRTQTVYINLGSDKHIFPGLKFDVYRSAVQGKRTFIGRIEIQKIMEKVSMAKVTALQNTFTPMVDGDVIINPVYREGQSIYFAFAGKFVKFSEAQVTKWIEQIGSKIEPEVTAKTNFVVVGEKGQEHPNYLSAVTFGIPLITEQVLMQYIGD